MFQEQKHLLESRTARFVSRLKHYFYEQEIPLEGEFCIFRPPREYGRRLEGKYRPIRPGIPWGRDWEQAWFHLTGRVPSEWRGKEVCARIDLGGEGLVFDEKGVPAQALSVHTIWEGVDFRRDRVQIARKAEGNEKVGLWIEVTAAQLFGLKLNNERGPVLPERYGGYEAKVRECVLAVFRRDIWNLYLDCLVLQNQMSGLPEQSVRKKRLLLALNRAEDLFSPEPARVIKSRKILQVELDKKSGPSDLSASAVGHAHIDTAWLWPIRESVRKCAGTFASQLQLLEKYPQIFFGASQAQHYDFVKQAYPGLFEKMRVAVARGRWEIQGGMWVEADCNLISGESMVRQILYGKRFFWNEFDTDVHHLWLPDVFGYSAAMPQILRKSGISALVTQKLSWNQFNRFPHHTFRWKGLDGSEVLVHFPPENDYNSELLPSALMKARDEFREGGFLDEFLCLYGIGDGGGGPTEEIIETGLRLTDMEGIPRVRFSPARDFLIRLEKRKQELETWSGELYLELHRGTYTTQGYNKRMNRILEGRLRTLEMLYALLPPARYPASALERLWKNVLLYQFHDIIPGSSITPVYEESRRHYRKLESESESLLRKAGAGLFPRKKDSLACVNPFSVEIASPVGIPAGWSGHEILDGEGSPVPSQTESEGLVALVRMPPLSAVTLRKGKPLRESRRDGPGSGKLVLENDLVRYRFSDQGTLVQADDLRTGRRFLSSGMRGNVLCLFEDRPVNWDAWDIDFFYENQRLEEARLEETAPIAHGPVRQGLLLHFRIGKSEIRQRVYLAGGSRRLDFVTEADWNESHMLLRVYFQADVSSDEASFEIQFGHVRRPTHRNTAWDMARFECVGHRFADLSEKTHGISLLNDCKYGYQAMGNTLSLSLLRAPSSPDPRADRGSHAFTYSFFPHEGNLFESGIHAEACALHGIPVFQDSDASGFLFPFRIEGRVMLESVKKAEDGDCTVLRLYEPFGRREHAVIFSQEPFRSAVETDLMENELRTLRCKGGRFELDFRPFEIRTLKLKRE